MPFAYFQRLSRRQQGIYLRSDTITAVPLPGQNREQQELYREPEYVRAGEQQHAERSFALRTL